MKFLTDLESLLVIAVVGFVAYYVWKLFNSNPKNAAPARDPLDWLVNWAEAIPALGFTSPDPWVLGKGPGFGGDFTSVPSGGGGGGAF